MSSLDCVLNEEIIRLMVESACSDWDKELPRGGGFDFGALIRLSATSIAISRRSIDVL